MDSKQFDRLREEVRGGSRTSWPFRKMSVGDVESIKDGYGGRGLDWIQAYAHNYAKQTGKKFETFTNEGTIHVRRVA